MTGIGLLKVLKVMAEKYCKSHCSSLGTLASNGAKGRADGLVGAEGGTAPSPVH